MDENKEFRNRLIDAMQIMQISQEELSRRTKINKSTISRYVKGEILPKVDNTFIISKALNVNPAWLMGMNVPMRDVEAAQNAEQDARLLKYFKSMKPENKEMILKLAESLAEKE